MAEKQALELLADASGPVPANASCFVCKRRVSSTTFVTKSSFTSSYLRLRFQEVVELHPKCQEVVEPLVPAAGRSALARRSLLPAVVVVACFEKLAAKVLLGGNSAFLQTEELCRAK